jgi:hypothetical protein
MHPGAEQNFRFLTYYSLGLANYIYINRKSTKLISLDPPYYILS